MKSAPTVIRATDNAWDDGEFHDRFVLRESASEGILEGWLHHGSDPAGLAAPIKAGVLADDRASGRLSIFGQIDKDRWHKVGIAQLDGSDYLQCVVADSDGRTRQVRAKLLAGAPESLRARLSACDSAPHTPEEDERTRPARALTPTP